MSVPPDLTGERLYAMWREVNKDQMIEIDEWQDLPSLTRNMWDYLAEGLIEA